MEIAYDENSPEHGMRALYQVLLKVRSVLSVRKKSSFESFFTKKLRSRRAPFVTGLQQPLQQQRPTMHLTWVYSPSLLSSPPNRLPLLRMRNLSLHPPPPFLPETQACSKMFTELSIQI